MKENMISIIIIVYNTPEQYFRKCIESVINQTAQEIEIILVNDGSDIKTKKICEEYESIDKRIKLINQRNMGESSARNTGIKNVTSENLMFVDSDDWIEKDSCEKLINYINKINNKYDIIIFNVYVGYYKKQIKNEFYFKEGILNKKDIEQIQLQNIEKGVTTYYPPECNISTAWAKIYNKKFVEKSNIKYNSNLARMEDAIFNMEAFEKAKNVFVCSEFLYHYQKNGFSICNSYSEKTVNYYEDYIELVKKYIKKYNKNEKFVDTLNIKIITSIDNYMYNYFFNKSNPNDYKKTKQEIVQLLKKTMYQNAMLEVKQKYLSIYNKLILLCIKRKNVLGLKILFKIKRLIKNAKRYGGF